jgi:hypothetical protein
MPEPKRSSKAPSVSETSAPQAMPVPLGMPFPYYNYPPGLPTPPFIMQAAAPPPQYAQVNQVQVNPPQAASTDDPTAFPVISEWLKALDDGPRGCDGHNFSQFIPNFEAQGIRRILEIADQTDFSRSDLMTICPGMSMGTAIILLKYARTDADLVRKDRR